MVRAVLEGDVDGPPPPASDGERQRHHHLVVPGVTDTSLTVSYTISRRRFMKAVGTVTGAVAFAPSLAGLRRRPVHPPSRQAPSPARRVTTVPVRPRRTTSSRIPTAVTGSPIRRMEVSSTRTRPTRPASGRRKASSSAASDCPRSAATSEALAAGAGTRAGGEYALCGGQAR